VTVKQKIGMTIFVKYKTIFVSCQNFLAKKNEMEILNNKLSNKYE